MANSPAGELTESPTQSLAAHTLKSELGNFLRSDLGKVYFQDVNVEKIVFDTTKPDPNLPGWIVRWTYKKDIGVGPNPHKNAKALTIPVAISAEGVLLDIYIKQKKGGVTIWSQRGFTISDEGDIDLNYFLVAGRDEEKLRAGIEVLCSDIAAKMKAALEALPKK